MTTRNPTQNPTPSPPQPRPRRHPARRLPDPPPLSRAGTRWRALALALALALSCLGLVDAGAASARKPHPPRAASSPSTAQILAPSAAAVPDALPGGPVYRCGDSYSAHACSGSAAKPLAVDDARTDAQRLQAQDVAARDKRLAAWYEAGRQQREARASAPAPGRAAAAAPACVSTSTMACVPKKPRPRRLLVPASAATAGKRRP